MVKILRSTVQNLAAWATRRPGSIHLVFINFKQDILNVYRHRSYFEKLLSRFEFLTSVLMVVIVYWGGDAV